MLQPTKVYVPVSVKDELPPKTGLYYTDEGECQYAIGREMWLNISMVENIFPATWLKEQSLYVFTREELENVLEDMIDNSWSKSAEGWNNEIVSLGYMEGADKENYDKQKQQLIKSVLP